MITVTEKQHRDKTRVYRIDGPKRETVVDFWQWLKDTRVIEDYWIEGD